MESGLAIVPALVVLLFAWGVVARPALALGLIGLLSIGGGIAVFVIARGAMHEVLGAILAVGGFGLIGIGAGVRSLEKIRDTVEAEARAAARSRGEAQRVN